MSSEDPRYTRKEPLKRHLLVAQAKVKELLHRVIHDHETVTINGDDGQPAAVLLPYSTYMTLIKTLARKDQP